MERVFEPVQERGYLVPEARGRRRFIVNALAADGARDDLHRPVRVVAPAADADPAQAAVSGGKQGGVPGEQPFFGQGCRVVPGGVERHLDDAVDAAIRRRQCAGIQAEAACDRRAHPVGGEDFAFDLARLHDILGERAQRGLAAHLGTQGLHAAKQFPLVVAHAREGFGEPGRILPDAWPFGALPDIGAIFSAQHAMNIAPIRRTGKRISAVVAEMRGLILRGRSAQPHPHTDVPTGDRGT